MIHYLGFIYFLMLKTIFSLLILLFCVDALFAQNQETIDSLQNVLKSNISDKEKVDTYVEIAQRYSRIDSLKTKKYAEKAIEIANDYQYQFGGKKVLKIYLFNLLSHRN